MVKRILVTGGAGQISYSLLFALAHGDLFGPNQKIALHILELPQVLDALRGVVMELEDCAFPLLEEIKIGSDIYDVAQGVHFAFLVGAKPRGPGMERKDLLSENSKIFIEQGRALNKVAAKDLITLVVGNPCNTNCLLAMKNAPDLSHKNFFAMTRLDENRGRALLARRAKVAVREVSHLTIWGNHSSTLVPDTENVRIGGKRVFEVIKERSWLEKGFIEEVQKRGATVIAARGKSSAASAAHAALGTMRALLTPTPREEWFSVGILSDGNPYGIQPGIIFSFPCRSKGDGAVEIVPSLKWTDPIAEKIRLTEKELLEERQMISHFLR